MTEQLHPNVDIVIDCADPEALAEFWAEALGYRIVGFGEPYCLLLPAERAYPPVILQRVPEPKQGKARIHFDLRVSDVDAEVERLGEAGCSAGRHRPGPRRRLGSDGRPRGQRVLRLPRRPLDV